MIAPNGSQTWHVKYNYTDANNDFGGRVVCKGSYIYVVGASYSTQYDMVLIKYDMSGNVVWTYRVPNFWGGANAVPLNMVIDNSGNAYIAGTVQGGSTGLDMSIVRINSDGTIQWGLTFDYGLDDYATSVALGSGDNLYITGGSADMGSFGASTDMEYTTIAVSKSSGTLLHTAHQNTAATSIDMAIGVKADAN